MGKEERMNNNGLECASYVLAQFIFCYKTERTFVSNVDWWSNNDRYN
ncbi:hypothetical protein BLGI_3399 [Brevibacillus laterosporus GI-9]|nr:hypothetical protein BLGI_3399 [Brevibacillus laterosporus GI-9]